MVWPRVCSVWPLVWTTVWPMVWTTVWPRVCSVCPMVWTMSCQSGQWCPKSVQSGQYLSLGIVGLANACFAYVRSGQNLSWVADFILGQHPRFTARNILRKKPLWNCFLILPFCIFGKNSPSNHDQRAKIMRFAAYVV